MSGLDDVSEAPIDLALRERRPTSAEITDLLAATPIGRIGIVDEGRPVVLPINFRWHDDAIVFRALDGQRIARAVGAAVCFEADGWDGATQTGWSVLMSGTLHEVDNWAEAEQLEALGLVPWAKDRWRRVWMRLDPAEISGRIVS